jgi:hypothetical protein
VADGSTAGEGACVAVAGKRVAVGSEVGSVEGSTAACCGAEVSVGAGAGAGAGEAHPANIADTNANINTGRIHPRLTIILVETFFGVNIFSSYVLNVRDFSFTDIDYIPCSEPDKTTILKTIY